jgi:hypothetical protein
MANRMLSLAGAISLKEGRPLKLLPSQSFAQSRSLNLSHSLLLMDPFPYDSMTLNLPLMSLFLFPMILP